MVKILGIDEAGRGALVGPMAIAGAMIDKDHEKSLHKLGARDSKTLSPERRQEVMDSIRKFVSENQISFSEMSLVVSPCQIYDNSMRGVNLNDVEARKMTQIIESMQPDVAYIDCPQQNTAAFEKKLRKLITNFDCELVVKNEMDESIPIVSTASIVAKLDRDEKVDQLKKSIGYDFGDGYPHDRAIEFLEHVLQASRERPHFIRWNWASVEYSIEKLKKEGKLMQPWVKDLESEIALPSGFQQRLKDFFQFSGVKKSKCEEEETSSAARSA